MHCSQFAGYSSKYKSRWTNTAVVYVCESTGGSCPIDIINYLPVYRYHALSRPNLWSFGDFNQLMLFLDMGSCAQLGLFKFNSMSVAN